MLNFTLARYQFHSPLPHAQLTPVRDRQSHRPYYLRAFYLSALSKQQQIALQFQNTTLTQVDLSWLMRLEGHFVENGMIIQIFQYHQFKPVGQLTEQQANLLRKCFDYFSQKRLQISKLSLQVLGFGKQGLKLLPEILIQYNPNAPKLNSQRLDRFLQQYEVRKENQYYQPQRCLQSSRLPYNPSKAICQQIPVTLDVVQKMLRKPGPQRYSHKLSKARQSLGSERIQTISQRDPEMPMRTRRRVFQRRQQQRPVECVECFDVFF